MTNKKHKTYWQFISTMGNLFLVLAFSAVMFGAIRSMIYNDMSLFAGFAIITWCNAMQIIWFAHRYKVWSRLYKGNNPNK